MRQNDSQRCDAPIRLALTCGIERSVRAQSRLVESSEQVVGVDEQSLAADLTEAKRLQQTSLDAVGLKRARGIEHVLELTKLRRDVVGVALRASDRREESNAHCRGQDQRGSTESDRSLRASVPRTIGAHALIQAAAPPLG